MAAKQTRRAGPRSAATASDPASPGAPAIGGSAAEPPPALAGSLGTDAEATAAAPPAAGRGADSRFPYEVALEISGPIAAYAAGAAIDCKFRHFHDAAIELRPGQSGRFNLGFRLFDATSRKPLFEGRMEPDENPVWPGRWTLGKLVIPRDAILFSRPAELLLDMVKEDEFSFAATPAEARRFQVSFVDAAAPAEAPAALNGQPAKQLLLERPHATAAADPSLPRPARRMAADAKAKYHVVFDVSDLAQYFQNARLPTGIQRVQMQVISAILANTPADCSATLACFSKFTDFWTELPPLFFQRLCRLALASGDTHAPDWHHAVAELKSKVEQGPTLAFPQGAFLINLGTSWWVQNYFLNVRLAKAHYGVRYVPFVHDCIPIITPEHCTADLTRDFITWVIGVFQHVDHIMVNSRATAADVVRVAGYLGHAIPEPAIVRLDAEYLAPEPRGPIPQEMQVFLRNDLRPGGYVLFVSTIESRKNHLLAFSAWLGLIKKHGMSRVPRLVCVGNQGWLNDAIYAKLAASKLLQQKVVMLSKVPDSNLRLLYENCLFTLFPSSYEGWGLPVTESLCCGKVALVANCSSLPEAGGDFAEYFEPGSEAELLRKLELLIFDAEYRQSRERHIAAQFRARSWADIGAEILGLVRQWSAEGRTAGQQSNGGVPFGLWPFEAEPGRYYALTENSEGRIWPGMVSGEMFRQGNGWWWPEPWGTRTKATVALLAFYARLGEAGGAMLYLGVRGNQGSACTATITLSAIGTREVPLGPDQDRWLAFHISGEGLGKLKAEREHPLFEVLFSADAATDFGKATNGADHRVASIGVRGFMVCAEEDTRSRLRFIEGIALGDLASLEDKPLETEYLIPVDDGRSASPLRASTRHR